MAPLGPRIGGCSCILIGASYTTCAILDFMTDDSVWEEKLLKIDRLLISNFRGISLVDASDLGDTIIIAGQNGSGKSCIFDAKRGLDMND
jgi:hypothetical protein